MEPKKTKKDWRPEGDPETVMPESGIEKCEEKASDSEIPFPDEKTEKEPYVDFSKLF